MQLKNFITKNKKLTVLILSSFLFFISYFWLWVFSYTIDKDLYYLIKEFVTNDKVTKNVVIIEIDDETLNKTWFPMDRKYFLETLKHVNEAKPATVWIDVFFADKWNNQVTDKLLAKQFKDSWNIVLGSAIINWKTLEKPYNLFSESVKTVSYYPPLIDPKNDKVYSIMPYRKFDNWEYMENFSFAMLRNYYSYTYSKDFSFNPKLAEKNYEYPNNNIYLWDFDERPELNINYSEPKKFNRLSFYDVYNGSFNKDLLKDKIVIIWYTAEWIKDDFIVPEYGIIKGIYIHANAINTVMNKDYIKYFEKSIEYIIWFLFAITIVYLNVFYIRKESLFLILFETFALFLIVFLAYLVSFLWFWIIFNFPFEFIFTLVAAFVLSSSIKSYFEEWNKIRLNKALSEYVSTDIANEILHWTWNVNLSWERKKITTFFSDLAWFTTLSEKLSPEELVWFLRWYLWEMSGIIMDNKWFINKYEWDAIMALWWVFWSTWETASYDACLSAIVQQKQIYLMNQKRLENWESEVWVRMWINCWDAIIGNIGREWRKMEFTALWDSVNLASRLEGVNKFYGTAICVSQSVYEEVKDKFEFRYLDKIRVKWKNEPINIYELLSLKWELSDMKKQIISEFDKAIELYISRNFEKALEIFTKLSEIWDKPSVTYKNRCALYLENPPLESWDLVWTMNEK